MNSGLGCIRIVRMVRNSGGNIFELCEHYKSSLMLNDLDFAVIRLLWIQIIVLLLGILHCDSTIYCNHIWMFQESSNGVAHCITLWLRHGLSCPTHRIAWVCTVWLDTPTLYMLMGILSTVVPEVESGCQSFRWYVLESCSTFSGRSNLAVSSTFSQNNVISHIISRVMEMVRWFRAVVHCDIW